MVFDRKFLDGNGVWGVILSVSPFFQHIFEPLLVLCLYYLNDS
jgi:hypothetical protein